MRRPNETKSGGSGHPRVQGEGDAGTRGKINLGMDGERESPPGRRKKQKKAPPTNEGDGQRSTTGKMQQLQR